MITAVVIATVGLGIGATTVAFAAIHATLLRPLPYAAPERLVRIYNRRASEPFSVLRRRLPLAGCRRSRRGSSGSRATPGEPCRSATASSRRGCAAAS